MSYSQAWLEDPLAIRGIFAEVTVYSVAQSTNIVLYLSSLGYMTADSSVSYNPIIIGGVKVTESLSLNGTAGLSFGDLEIDNSNGTYDSWLDSSQYIWVNRPIKIYMGDPFWLAANLTQIHTDFYLLFDGVVSDIDSRSRNKLNIKIRDKLERLNTPLTETKLGVYGTWSGGQNNKDTILPIVFGEVHNITPLLIDPSLLEYQFNGGPSESLIEVRDNGVPVYTATTLTGGATVNLSTGKFKLTAPLVGTCTVSVQGINNSINLSTGDLIVGTYTNSIANIVAIIVTQYGKASSRLNSTTELDLVNLQAFNTINTQYTGIYISDRANVINVCQEIVSSIGGQIFISRLGKLQILQLGVPISTSIIPSMDITSNDILQQTLEVSTKIAVSAATKLGYCKNYTIQDNLTSSIPPQHKDLFKKEYLTTTSVDNTVKSLYNLDSEPEQVNTLLISHIDADAEAARQTDYYSIPRVVYKFTGTSKLLSLQLGQQVNLINSRFNLSAGKIGQVITLTPNWSSSTVEVEVLI